MKKLHIVATILLGYMGWTYFHISPPTTISVRIGQTFNEVARASTFPVTAASNIPNNSNGSGATWVTEPAVVIQFNDPEHGFTLPATTFAAIGYMDGKVDDISTSPMLGKLPFDEAATVLARLQRQFQDGGWRPQPNNVWFDLAPLGREQLRKHVRKESNGFMKTTMLIVPEKYEMTFRLWCAARCDSQIGLDRYLIDIGISQDIGFERRKRKRQQEETMTP